MRFSPEFIERVREANNVVDIIGQYTQLKPAAGGYMGRCPFPDHPEKTPSFSVSESKQVYNCFGCHKKGNVFTFLQQYNGMNFPEAIEYLAQRAHIAFPEISREESAKEDALSKKKKEILKINRLATHFFVEQFKRLPVSHPAKVYAKEKRGLSEETLATFFIGYAPEEWDGLAKYLESQGAFLPLAEEARLIKARRDGKSGYFDFFRDRLMFPIFNTMNEPVAFGGRVISQGEPKYLNSPETPVFTKGKILYGSSQTARYIRAEDQALVVEGYMDLVSLFQAGIHNVVGTMGTALTHDHGRILRRATQNVVALFDGDQAGQDAAERSLPILLAADMRPKGLVLPDDMDPDDFVRARGADELKALISSAKDLFSLTLDQWMIGYRGEASQKVKLADQLTPVLGVIQDDRLKQLYIQEAAAKLRVEERWLRQAIVRPAAAQGSKETKVAALANPLTAATSSEEPAKVSLKGLSKPEGLLMGLILKNRANFEVFEQSQVLSQIFHPGALWVLKKAASVYRQDPEKFDKLVGLLVSFVDLPGVLMAAEGYGHEQETKLLQDCIKRIREQSLKVQAERLAQEAKLQPTPEKLEQIMNIHRDRLALGKDVE